MASLAFQFEPDAVTPETDVYEAGISGVNPPPAAPVLSSSSFFSPQAAQYDQPGPWVESATVRYMALFDETALKIRMFKTTDNWQSRAEVDAAGAPAVNSDAAINDLFFGSVRDPRSGVNKTWHVIWNTDGTVAVVPFNQDSDTWGAKFTSTLSYLDLGVNPALGFTVAFQQSTTSVVFAASVDLLQVGNSFYSRAYYAKCNVSTGVFSASWTALGNTANGTENQDLIQTQVAAGGYTAGSGLLNVDTTAAPFPQAPVLGFRVYILDSGTGVMKAALAVTAINSGTQWAVVSNGLDASCNENDIVIWARSWQPVGAVSDDQDNIHFRFQVESSATVLDSFIYHQVMHPDNTLSTANIVKQVSRNDYVGGLTRPLARPMVGGGTELIFPYQVFQAGTLNYTLYVARATAGDAPAWAEEQLLPVAAGLSPSGVSPFAGFAFANLVAPQIAAYFIQAAAPFTPASAASLYSMTNDGPGLGWSLPSEISSFNYNQTNGLVSHFSATGAGSTPAVPVRVGIIKTRIPYPYKVDCCDVNFVECENGGTLLSKGRIRTPKQG